VANEPKPVKCVCGNKVEVDCHRLEDYSVICGKCYAGGPYRKTKRGAIRAWNRLRGYCVCKKQWPWLAELRFKDGAWLINLCANCGGKIDD